MDTDDRSALICGVNGQDGAYLAQLLLYKGYRVWGTSRDALGSDFGNLKRLGIRDRVKTLSMLPEDFRSVLVAFQQSRPDEVYYLAGQSSVGLSFEQPAETIQSITLGTLNLLEACRIVNHSIRTQKIVCAAKRIAQGSGETLQLGRIDIARDWGWAPEYVDAMWRMLQQPEPRDFVIATGETHTLQDFVAESFRCLGLDWRDHVRQNQELMRPTDILVGRADPRQAEQLLAWKATYRMHDVVRRMIDAG